MPTNNWEERFVRMCEDDEQYGDELQKQVVRDKLKYFIKTELHTLINKAIEAVPNDQMHQICHGTICHSHEIEYDAGFNASNKTTRTKLLKIKEEL